MGKFERSRELLMLWKSYLARSASYITIFNTGVLVFLFLSDLEKYGIDINMTTWGIPIVGGGLMLMVGVGFVEDKLGFWKQEVNVANLRNPCLLEIREDVKALRKEVRELKKIRS